MRHSSGDIWIKLSIRETRRSKTCTMAGNSTKVLQYIRAIIMVLWYAGSGLHIFKSGTCDTWYCLADAEDRNASKPRFIQTGYDYMLNSVGFISSIMIAKPVILAGVKAYHSSTLYTSKANPQYSVHPLIMYIMPRQAPQCDVGASM